MFIIVFTVHTVFHLEDIFIYCAQPQNVDNIFGHPRVESRRRFIEQQQRRVRNDLGREAQPPFFAAGNALQTTSNPDHRVSAFGQAHLEE